MIHNVSPIGSEYKNVSDMSQYCDKCQNSIIGGTKWLKQIYTDKNGAATAVALRQTTAYRGTGGVTIANSWFSTDEMWSVSEHRCLSKQLKRASPESYNEQN